MQEWGNSCHLLKNLENSQAGLTAQTNNSCALVVEDSQLQGIFSERDLVRLLAEGIDLEGITAEEVMSREVITLTATGSEDLFTALNMLRQHQIRHLPIIDARHQLLGLVSEKNIRQNLQPINLMKWRRVGEIMNRSVLHAPPNLSVRQVARLMANHRVSYVAIVEERERDGLLIPLGIITERDLVQFQSLSLDFKQPAPTLMSAPLFLISPQDSLWSVLQLMEQRRVRRLVVAGDRGELEGIITQSNLLQVFDPTEMYGLIETLRRQVCQLEKERAEFLENRTAELEQQIRVELNQRQQSEEKFRAIFEQTFQLVVLMALDGTVIEANQTALDFGGLTLADVAGQPLWSTPWWRISAATQESLRQAISQAARGEFVRYEVDILGAEERVATIDFSLKPVTDERGRVTMLLSEGRDITEKKQLEAQFLRAQRLESLGTLASGIAHDLNNIFTPILAVTQLLPLHLPDLEPNLQKLLGMCQTSVRRGADLVTQILTFTRGAQGQRCVVQVKHLIAEINQIAQETFPKNIEIEIDLPHALWTVNGDATQLHQVLMNLVVNARDAMVHGGTLRISGENFVINPNYARMHLDAQEGNYILITVSDTGAGIPSEIKERVFEPFFTTKDMGRGTGLGLATVLGIVKSHGGFLDVDSEVGRGSQFRVFLPASETREILAEESETLPRGHGELILVVDDEAPIRDINQTLLETYNYRVLTANNGIDAIALYSQNQHEIALVLMDIMMPSMDGQVAIRTLKKINSQVKVIAVSGLETPEISSELDDSCLNFLAKPYSTEAFLKTIHQAISC